QSFQSPVRTGVRYVVVRVQGRESRFQVAAYVRVIRTAHDLHVLLRHRLSDSPTAARTASSVRYSQTSIAFPSRYRVVQVRGMSISAPLLAPRPRTRTEMIT